MIFIAQVIFSYASGNDQVIGMRAGSLASPFINGIERRGKIGVDESNVVFFKHLAAVGDARSTIGRMRVASSISGKSFSSSCHGA